MQVNASFCSESGHLFLTSAGTKVEAEVEKAEQDSLPIVFQSQFLAEFCWSVANVSPTLSLSPLLTDAAKQKRF
jgi:hypothetical protein